MAINNIIDGGLTGYQKEIAAHLLAKTQLALQKYSFAQHLAPQKFSSPLWSEIRKAGEVEIGNFIAPDAETVVQSRVNAKPFMGEIPMFGIKRIMAGKEFANLQKLAQGESREVVGDMYALDQAHNIEAFFKLMQLSFQRMLSEGAVALNSEVVENFSDLKLDFLLPNTNRMGVETINKITYNDIYNVIANNPVSKIYMTQFEANLLGSDDSMQKQFAMIKGGLPSGATLGVPELNMVFERFGVEVVDLPSIVKSGKTNVSAWKKGVITFTPNEKAGVLGHARTPENEFGRGAGGIQTDLDNYSLFSVMNFSQDPFGVSNRLETYATPILANAEDVIIMDSNTQQE